VPMVGLLALPIMFAHDALLTGDPLYWTGIAARYAAQTTAHIPTSVEVVRELVDRYWSMGALTLLAGLGAVRLLAERRYGLLVGLVALGPAIAAFLVFLAARQIYVPIRYTAAVDVAVIFAAGLGIGAVSVSAQRWPPLDRLAVYAGRAGSAATVAVVAVVALLLAGPYWQTNPSLRSTVRASLHLAIDADRAVPVLAAELAQTGPAPPGAVAVLVPGPIRPRLVVDLGLLLTAVGGTAAAKVDVAGGYPAAGQLVLHDRTADAPAPGWADLEIEEPRTVGSVTLEPLLADPASGLWVIAVR